MANDHNIIHNLFWDDLHNTLQRIAKVWKAIEDHWKDSRKDTACQAIARREQGSSYIIVK